MCATLGVQVPASGWPSHPRPSILSRRSAPANVTCAIMSPSGITAPLTRLSQPPLNLTGVNDLHSPLCNKSPLSSSHHPFSGFSEQSSKPCGIVPVLCELRSPSGIPGTHTELLTRLTDYCDSVPRVSQLAHARPDLARFVRPT